MRITNAARARTTGTATMTAPEPSTTAAVAAIIRIAACKPSPSASVIAPYTTAATTTSVAVAAPAAAACWTAAICPGGGICFGGTAHKYVCHKGGCDGIVPAVLLFCTTTNHEPHTPAPITDLVGVSLHEAPTYVLTRAPCAQAGLWVNPFNQAGPRVICCSKFEIRGSIQLGIQFLKPFE